MPTAYLILGHKFQHDNKKWPKEQMNEWKIRRLINRGENKMNKSPIKWIRNEVRYLTINKHTCFLKQWFFFCSRRKCWLAKFKFPKNWPYLRDKKVFKMLIGNSSISEYHRRMMTRSTRLCWNRCHPEVLGRGEGTNDGALWSTRHRVLRVLRLRHVVKTFDMNTKLLF